MVHLYLLARGILKDLHQWEHDLSSIFLKYRCKAPENFNVSGTPIMDGILRISVRPVQLYEMVFPEEALEEVLGMMMPCGEIPYSITEGKSDKKRKKEHGLMMRYTNYLRRFLGLEKLPEKWKRTDNVQTLMLATNSIGIHPIGIKKDRRDCDGIEEL